MSFVVGLLVGVVVGVIAHVPLMNLYNKIKDKIQKK